VRDNRPMAPHTAERDYHFRRDTEVEQRPLRRAAYLIDYLLRYGIPWEDPALRRPLKKVQIGGILCRTPGDIYKLYNADSVGRREMSTRIVSYARENLGLSSEYFFARVPNEQEIDLNFYVLDEFRPRGGKRAGTNLAPPTSTVEQQMLALLRQLQAGQERTDQAMSALAKRVANLEGATPERSQRRKA